MKFRRLISFVLALVLWCLSCPAVLAAEERTLAKLVEEMAGQETDGEVKRAELYHLLCRAAEILGREAREWQEPDGLLTYPLLCRDLCAFLESADYRLPCYNKEDLLPDGAAAEARLLADAMVIAADLAGTEKVVTYGELAVILERFFILMEAEADAGALFGAPESTVEPSGAVELSYFEDACMIGHSQVRGYSCYSTIPMTFYGVNGAKAREGFEHEYETSEETYETLESALSKQHYGVIYFMYGVNDCRSGIQDPDGFIQGMKLHIELVKETQEDPTVFLLSVCPMMKFLQKTHPYNTVAIYNINRMIYGLARYYGFAYLNMYEVLGDEYGHLLREIDCADGLHFGANGYERLTEYLLCHTVS